MLVNLHVIALEVCVLFLNKYELYYNILTQDGTHFKDRVIIIHD